VDKDLLVARQTACNTAATLTQLAPREAGQLERLLRTNVSDTKTAFGAAVAFEPRAFAPDRERFSRYVCRSAQDHGVIVRDLAYDYTAWDWYRLPRESRKVVWTEPYFDRGGGEILMCTCSAPFFRGEEFQGVATVDVSLEDLRERLLRASTGGEYCMIVSRTGTFVSHPEEARIMADSVFDLAERCGSPELAEAGHKMTAGETGVRRLVDPETGENAWMVFVPVASVGWSLAAVIPESQVQIGRAHV
jgi:phosphoserine phosphatase RsbU/P